MKPRFLFSRVFLFFILLFLVGFAPQPLFSLDVNLAVDVDRNGIVDFKTDETGEEAWSLSRGALFLNNNDSDEDTGTPDHQDQKVNGIDDLLDLARIVLKKIPELPEQSNITLEIDPNSMGNVRLFYKNLINDYVPLALDKAPNIPGDLLRKEHVEIRIEANSFATRQWNGITSVTATVQIPSGEKKSDTIVLKVAPFILASNFHEAHTLYVREFPGRNDMFIQQLKDIAPRSGFELYIIPAGEPYRSNHIWCQDAMEIGFTQMPGKRMNVVLKANRNKTLDNFPKNTLLGPDYGWFSCGAYREPFANGSSGNGWIDWFGNLEATPPVPKYPLGRIYYGANKDASLDPEIIAMFDAQGVQGPALRLDTGWLLIKHVDEMICFVPSGNPQHPCKLLVVDADAMIALAEKWNSQGKGSFPMLVPFQENMTVSSFLENTSLLDFNRRIQKERMEPNIELILKELKLRKEDIIRIPAFFNHMGQSLVPNMVNSAVVNQCLLIADPHGPSENREDLLQEHVRHLLKDIPLEIHFLDDRQYHKWSGNVHCATNARRNGFPPPWWKRISN